MPIKAMWAQARDAQGRPVIGFEGGMPWHLPEDLTRFRALTLGHVVIMGRHTWESIPQRFRPLAGRTNIVVTSLQSLEGASIAGSLEGALELADALVESGDLAAGATRWVIGGSRLFEAALEVADALEITQIDLTVPGDTFAPDIAAHAWRTGSKTPWALSSGGVQYRFVTYVRRDLSA
jgi:dihydrofolate reductase